ncbi:activating signal cointegrator 1 complex subunit 2 homolog [Lytechinus pictus]|uniref:activating signal cointegrator 1 complex subunit 2 homolog n=1 Tax=Lytechinus pictus TaxID=7653 RepID=UPI0030B9B95E
MSGSTSHNDRGGIVRSPSEIAAEEELPPSLPSDSEHSAIHDQLTAPMGSYKMTYSQQIGNSDDDSFSESDVDDRRKSETSDGGDDEKSVHLSNYASDEAVSFVESCESFDRYTDSSDEDESKGDNMKGASGVCRRRQSNSDSDTADDSNEEETIDKSPSKASSRDDANLANSGNTSLKMNNPTEVTEHKSSEKFVGIWDDDGSNRKESSKPVRKLWSDYVYKPEAKTARGQLRAGARFTNSFTDKRQTEPVDHSWNMNQCNRFPPQLGMGLGRGLMHPNNNMQYDPNSMRQPGSSRSYQQQRRPNNPYCHYQQQQRYFGMPRGSYASVVQKGAANQGRTDSRNTSNTNLPSRNIPGNENRFPRDQQSYNRQNQNYQQGPNRQNQNYQQQRPSGQGPQRQQPQSYNRGTVTATQILQQQRMQQSQKQQPNGPQRGHPHGQQIQGQPGGKQDNRPSWQPPKGPHVRHIMIGSQQVYLIQPSYNRRPIAEEDPAIVRADPPVPPPYVMLPGGIPLALPMPIRGNFGANTGMPGGQIKTGGSGGMRSYYGVNQQPTAVN